MARGRIFGLPKLRLKGVPVFCHRHSKSLQAQWLPEQECVVLQFCGSVGHHQAPPGLKSGFLEAVDQDCFPRSWEAYVSIACLAACHVGPFPAPRDHPHSLWITAFEAWPAVLHFQSQQQQACLFHTASISSFSLISLTCLSLQP